jgi:hypothetical protein
MMKDQPTPAFPFIKSLLEGLEGNYRTTTKREVVLKDGTVMPTGSAVTCDFPDGFSYLFVNFAGRKLKLYYKNAHTVLKGFQKEPSLDALTNMMEKGVVTTPLGSRTEPDGTGRYGEPSWLLVMELV